MRIDNVGNFESVLFVSVFPIVRKRANGGSFFYGVLVAGDEGVLVGACFVAVGFIGWACVAATQAIGRIEPTVGGNAVTDERLGVGRIFVFPRVVILGNWRADAFSALFAGGAWMIAGAAVGGVDGDLDIVVFDVADFTGLSAEAV